MFYSEYLATLKMDDVFLNDVFSVIGPKYRNDKDVREKMVDAAKKLDILMKDIKKDIFIISRDPKKFYEKINRERIKHFEVITGDVKCLEAVDMTIVKGKKRKKQTFRKLIDFEMDKDVIIFIVTGKKVKLFVYNKTRSEIDE